MNVSVVSFSVMALKVLLIVLLSFVFNESNFLSVDDAIRSHTMNNTHNSRQSAVVIREKRSNEFDENSCRDINSCKEEQFYRECNCDNLCPHFNDCCWDAAPDTSVHKDDVPKMSCIRLIGREFYWIVSDCPDKYKDAKSKAKCRKDPSTNAFEPDIAVPVWSKSKEMAYHNRFCAECNDVTDFVPYNISVKGFDSGCERPATSSPMGVLKHYLQQNSSCIVEFLNDDGIKQRQCFSSHVSTCFSNDSQTQKSCEHGLLNPVYVLDGTHYDGTSAIGFRNYHCFQCSTMYPSKYLSCVPGASLDAYPMRVLIDTSELTVADGRKDDTNCGKEQIYDHIYVRNTLYYCFMERN